MNRIASSLLLLLTAFIWGIAFVAQSVGMDHVGPWTFVFARFVLSAVVLLPVTVFVGKKSFKEHADTTPAKLYVAGGGCCGLFLGIASIAQQAGMQYTTAGKAGFITALYVIFVPVFGMLLGKRPPRKIWLCVVLGMAGLYLISVKEGFRIEAGDALVMVCAIVFSMQILSADHFSPRVGNVVLLSNIQFFVAALVGLVGMLAFEQPRLENVMAAGVPILYAGVFSGAAGYTLQIVAQKNADPAVASLIMSMESVFAALAGWILLGQGLTGREFLGCVILFAAVVLAELPGRKKPAD